MFDVRTYEYVNRMTVADELTIVYSVCHTYVCTDSIPKHLFWSKYINIMDKINKTTPNLIVKY